jgi:hypothetical protein
MDFTTETFLDGNVTGGELRDVFVTDVTTATCQCNSCGRIDAFAQAHVYEMQPGMVVRCSNCENMLMRVVKGRGHAWLDLRGLKFLEVPMP